MYQTLKLSKPRDIGASVLKIATSLNYASTTDEQAGGPFPSDTLITTIQTRFFPKSQVSEIFA
jgi:hypothetical protein